MAGYAEIESILRENNLTTYFNLFQEAQLTDNELQFVEDSHLKEMGIPLGPRLKICSALRARGYSSSVRPQKPIAINKSRLPPVAAPIRSETPFSQPQRTGSNPDSFGIPRTGPETAPAPIFSPAAPPGFTPSMQPFGQPRTGSGLDSCTCYQVPCTCSRPFGNPASNLGSILEFSAFGRSSSSVFSPFPATTPASTLFSSPGVFSSTYSPFPSDPWGSDKTWQAPTVSEQDKLKQEQIKQEQIKQEQAKQEQQRLEQQRLEQQRLEQQKLEQQKLEQQRLEQQRLEQQRLEQQRLEQQRLEQQKIEQQKLEQQWLEQQKLEQQRLQAEQKFSTVQKNGDKRKQEEIPKSESKTKKEKEPPQTIHPAVEDRTRTKVVTGNAFGLLDHESDEEQTDKGKQKEDVPTKKEPKSKEAKKSSSVSAATPAPAPTAASTAAKPKCECGQIVHPSVLNPITEFQMQDRQAHLTSKRHQTYLAQQEALARKEKEAKLKQEKADAQKAKEDAQRAKEEAQRAIEEAQRLIEEAQKAEEAEAKAREGGKKKPVKKTKNKPKDKKPEEQPVEASTTDGKTKLSAKDADLKRKKQLASEMQQEANQLYNQGLYAKAVDRYTDGINLNPNSAVLYSNRAQAETKCYQYERAVNDCLKAIELDPGFAKSYHRASACYVKLGDLTKAKFMLAQCKNACNASAAIDKKDETPFHIKLVADLEAALMRVKKFMQEKMYKEAIDLLQNKITSQMPEAFSSHYLLAEAYIMTGNFIAAHDVAHKFMIKYPRLSDTLILESLFAYYNEAKLEKAAELLKSVLADDKDNARASKLLDKIQRIDILKKTAEELHVRKNYQKAVQGFGQALSIDRDNKHVTATLLFLRGSVYSSLTQYVEAKRDLDESLDLWPSFLRARKLRASVNEKLGNNQVNTHTNLCGCAVCDECLKQIHLFGGGG